MATKDYAFTAPAVKAYIEAASLVSNTTGIAEVDVDMTAYEDETDPHNPPEALAEGDALYANALANSSRE